MSVSAYADLEIRIQGKREGLYPVEITFNGDQEFPVGSLDPAKRPKGIDGDDPKLVGESLFNWLFDDEKLKIAWAEARGQQSARRIRLRIDEDAKDLHPEPWELLRDPGGAAGPQDLTADSRTPFSRYLAISAVPGKPVFARPVKVLVAVADPAELEDQGFSDLKGETEVAALEEALKRAKLQDPSNGPSLKLTRLEGACTLEALRLELKKGYHVLHFIGHGAWPDIRKPGFLYFAKYDSNKELRPVTAEEFAAMVRRQIDDAGQDEDRLRLVYLSTCQSAKRDPLNPFRGVAPELVKCGVPAVVAMQNDVATTTAIEFSRAFYAALVEHGQIDRAMNSARDGRLTAKDKGAGIPVLFMRLRNAELFGKRGVLSGGLSPTDWQILCDRIARGKCTPILGPGVATGLLPASASLSTSLAASRNYPFDDKENLRRVTQFLSRLGDPDWREALQDRLAASLNHYLPGRPGLSRISELKLEQWVELASEFETEIHQQLASLGLPLYLTTNFDPFLSLALKAQKREVRDFAIRWRERVEEPPNMAQPSPESPVVLHLFGQDSDPESMVLTEDDHLDYLTRMSRDHDLLMPRSVEALLNKNTLLFLGYKLEDLDLKVILRGLLNYLDVRKYDRVQLAVQLENDRENENLKLELQKYLTASLRPYFSADSPIGIYWGSAHQFMNELSNQMGRPKNG
ncbi:MAG TPA: CHAT domain-containing protein [Bryobacteraceae bacterium]|nr:CHAT domain-containing protein [Bryobacteraceae bacterium]